jgi:magnesium transporter
MVVVLGEIANFAAYTFAPAILVTPLGALSVLIGYLQLMWDTDDRAVLAAMFLKEELGPLGRIGCAICLIGSVIIVLHAPPDTDIETVDEILNFALQPGISFLLLC